ncbi:Nucleic-acid-binding protein from mobile element jockey [Eumeta japonica]|uniref:Nucleic-acid-binding protein from mobile element jockey n=1 Tax=Eumeta variegata TaxID=151549 RepID=A0A4C1XWL0_EUMVA|nr:Nucleic-acid-binding protein from mobile element jockey [Eumeta japonica]
MEVDAAQTEAASPAPLPKSPQAQVPVTTSLQVEAARASVPAPAGSKPTAPSRVKMPPLIFVRKGVNFIKISADCTRLRINYTKAVRTADDGIKITCSDVETFRKLNKYLVDNKVQFHTYALEEERKIKMVIRGIPTDFPVEEIKADLCDQVFPVLSVNRLCRRDGSPLWLVLVVLPRTDEAKNLSRTLNKVCGLSGIRVEAPHKKGGPGQCHRCQLYGHAAANCNANPHCSKCQVPHWTEMSPHAGFGGETSCVNCGQIIRPITGDLKAPQFTHGLGLFPKALPPHPPLPDLENFPVLTSKTTPVVSSPRPAPPPTVGDCSGSRQESARRARCLPSRPHAGSSSFGDDIQTVMAVLRAVSSSEIAEFASQLRACRNVEEKLLVLVRWTPQTEEYYPSFVERERVINNILELTNCMSEYGVDIAFNSNFLKPNRPRACAIAGYVQYERTGRTGGASTIAALHCCPIDIPPINMEATGCRLAMTGHRTLVIVSVYYRLHNRCTGATLRALSP